MARAQGIVVGLGASWINALTEPRLQSVAERILPPSPAQKQEEAIHYGFGAGLGVAHPVAAKRWRVVSRGRGALARLAIYASTHASVLPALGIQRPPWRLAPAAGLWESGSHVVFGTALGALRRAVEALTWEGAG
jgi:putative membrane protein